MHITYLRSINLYVATAAINKKGYYATGKTRKDVIGKILNIYREDIAK